MQLIENAKLRTPAGQRVREMLHRELMSPVYLHQLRHAAATRIRKAAGLEAAAIVLGHSSAALTDATYAERDANAAVRVMTKIG